MKKSYLIILIMFLFISKGFAENFGDELLKHSSLSVSCPVSVTMGSIFNYAKLSTGTELKLCTELFENKSYSTGICTAWNFNPYIIKREEISTFRTNVFSGGVWYKKPLENNCELMADVTLGLGVTRIDALSIDGKSINDYFNSFVIGTDVVVMKEFWHKNGISVLWNAGGEGRIHFEQASAYGTLGAVAGITVRAR